MGTGPAQEPGSAASTGLSRGFRRLSWHGARRPGRQDERRTLGGDVNALVIDQVAPSVLYAAEFDSGIFKSTDRGGGWASVFGGQAFALAIDPSTPSTLYAGMDPGGIFRSTDAGGTWTPIHAGMPSFRVLSLALDPSGTTTLHAGLCGKGVWQPTLPIGTSLLLASSARAPGASGAFAAYASVIDNVTNDPRTLLHQ